MQAVAYWFGVARYWPKTMRTEQFVYRSWSISVQVIEEDGQRWSWTFCFDASGYTDTSRITFDAEDIALDDAMHSAMDCTDEMLRGLSALTTVPLMFSLRLP
jgi:hypothetical protein